MMIGVKVWDNVVLINQTCPIPLSKLSRALISHSMCNSLRAGGR